ncbi:DUF5710 domain-containing protein [Cupriavidus pinatubonensis]|uniref:DUF5710 domain-containing protein n=1 Tax=Cupriavidus pinatubonensis TaxID=248026 RepID=UPI001CC74D7A|nr:DUF5710 domain-containing protein [Cupriavidus pinatubonensis]
MNATINRAPRSDVQCYLHVPYEQKEQAKKRGAKFDGVERKWYVPFGCDIWKFRQWLPHATQSSMKSIVQKDRRFSLA